MMCLKQKRLSDKTQENTTVEAQAKQHQGKKNTFFSKGAASDPGSYLFPCHWRRLDHFNGYQPASKELITQKEEVARLQIYESQYNSLQADTTLSYQHVVAVTLVNIYQIQNNINIARIALTMK
jgi:hypothetical protein